MSTGRTAPAYPTLTLSSGESIQIRRLATGIVQTITAAVITELQPTKPQPPIERVEVSPGEWLDIPNSSHPDHQAALEQWSQRVKSESAVRFARLVADYAILTPTDDEAVQGYRAAMDAIGVTLPDTDRQIYVWNIVAPNTDDHKAIFNAVLGLSEPSREAVNAQLATFRGGSSRETD